MNKKSHLLWFIIGFGVDWRIIASLSVSEAIVLASAFFVIPNEYPSMKKDGTSFYFGLAIITILGCLVASMVNHTPWFLAMRGLAATSILACSIPFGHQMIRKDPNGFKWMFVGLSVSLLLKTLMNFSSLYLVANDPLYWKSRVFNWGLLPIIGWYLNMPKAFSIGGPLFVVFFSMTMTTSGRGTAVGALFFAIIAFIGGRTQKGMSRFSRFFWRFLFCGFILTLGMHSLYRTASTRGWLGEAARSKYYIQTQGRKSIGRLILGGRGQSFVGLLACRDNPIIGWGPWAMDEDFRYRDEFIMRYGTEQDVDKLMRVYDNPNSSLNFEYRLIACHSHITEFWLWYGIFGLLFWVYYVFILFRYYKEDCYAVPQWFGWLACSIPGVLWNVAFNPFSQRIVLPMVAVACLMARAVRKGQFTLPPEMIAEIAEAERMSPLRKR